MVDLIFNYQFRLILIGDSTVGKSCLLKYFTDGRFEEMVEPTVGVDFFARLIDVRPGVRVKLQLWDTAGQERFRSITRSYYRNSVGAMLVYDITKRKSFEHLEEWLEESRIHILPHRAVYMVIGHKADMDSHRAVTYKEGRHFAEKHGFRFMETSAITGQNIEEAFHAMACDIYSLLERGLIKVEDGWDGVKDGLANREGVTLSLAQKKPESDSGCC